MKKIKCLALTTFAAFALIFAGCENGASLEEDTNTDTPQETPVETPAETTPEPEEEKEAEEEKKEEEDKQKDSEEDLGYTPPTLPASVGEDPFKGKTYCKEVGSNSSYNYYYKFYEDGTVLYYAIYNSTSEKEDRTKFYYTYNADTKIMYLSVIASALDEPDMLTFKEWKEKYVWEDYKDDFASEEEFNTAIAEYLEDIKTYFEELNTWKVEDSNGTLTIIDPYFTAAPQELLNSNLSLKCYSTNFNIFADFEKNKITIQNDFEHPYIITSITSDTICSKRSDEDVLTLSYTLRCEDGYLKLTISGKDSDSTAKLRPVNSSEENPEYILSNTQNTDTYTLVTE